MSIEEKRKKMRESMRERKTTPNLNLNPTIEAMERREAVAERKAREGCLTEKVRKELNRPYDPGVSATISKLKKRKQIA